MAETRKVVGITSDPSGRCCVACDDGTVWVEVWDYEQYTNEPINPRWKMISSGPIPGTAPTDEDARLAKIEALVMEVANACAIAEGFESYRDSDWSVDLTGIAARAAAHSEEEERDGESLCHGLDNGSLVVDENGAHMDLALWDRVLTLIDRAYPGDSLGTALTALIEKEKSNA